MVPIRILLLAALLTIAFSVHRRNIIDNPEWITSGDHDSSCFSQGLSFINDTHILESCGLYGQSFFHILEFTLDH